MLLQPVQGLPLLEPKITNNVRVKMVNSIQNSPETPQIDSCLSPWTHAKDDPAVSTTSVHNSNSIITETKNGEFLHNTGTGTYNDSSQRFKRLSEILQLDNTKHFYCKS